MIHKSLTLFSREIHAHVSVYHNYLIEMNTNLTSTDYQAHPYHLVEPSLWPLLCAFAMLITIRSILPLFIIGQSFL